MHGRKRILKPPSEEETRAVQKKKQAFCELSNLLFERRASNDFSLEALALTAKLLKNNPDFYSAWNYRREILLKSYAELGISENPSQDKVPTDIGSFVRDEELVLTVAAIKKNPKSYGAWHHRRWIIERFVMNFDEELELCKTFLQSDQRNFHCWNYRRFIATAAGISSSNELDFTTLKIEENFSNYSAFHHRSVYIKNYIHNNPEIILISEFELLTNAYYTEPDDQSAWWYLQFLLKILVEFMNSSENIWVINILQQQIENIRNLIDIENTCKWAYAILIELLNVKMKIIQCQTFDLSDHRITIQINENELSNIRQEKHNILMKLCDIDPSHICRYKYLLSLS